jgi:hypothetical protein
MYYSEIFFKKSIYDIVEDDLINFFKEDQEENGILEFKSGDVTLEKIYKEVAALHNSQGGLIIVGSPKPIKDKTGKESFYGELTNSIHKHKDILYQKISSHISPSPAELRIHDVKTSTGKVQIIDIPKSSNPPHQCLNDGIYYLRFETETRFAPHGIVETLFNRRIEPVANCFIESHLAHNGNKKYIELTLKIINESKIPLIGLHYVVNIDNIYSAKSHDPTKFYWNDIRGTIKDGHLIRHSHSVDRNQTVLVNGVSFDSDYLINNLDEPLLFSVLLWGSNMNLRKFFFIISPKDNKKYKLPIIDDSQYAVNHAVNTIVSSAKERGEKIDEKGFLKLVSKLFTIENDLKSNR